MGLSFHGLPYSKTIYCFQGFFQEFSSFISYSLEPNLSNLFLRVETQPIPQDYRTAHRTFSIRHHLFGFLLKYSCETDNSIQLYLMMISEFQERVSFYF